MKQMHKIWNNYISCRLLKVVSDYIFIPFIRVWLVLNCVILFISVYNFIFIWQTHSRGLGTPSEDLSCCFQQISSR